MSLLSISDECRHVENSIYVAHGSLGWSSVSELACLISDANHRGRCRQRCHTNITAA